MTNKKLLPGIFSILLVFVLFLSGCATNVATNKATNFDKKPLEIVGYPKYTILGPVVMEKNWFGILGFTTPSVGPVAGNDIYVYQSGGITYVDLLAEARKNYSDADAVIDIKVDYSGSHYMMFFASRKNLVSGVAIKYSRGEVDNRPQNEVYVLGERR